MSINLGGIGESHTLIHVRSLSHSQRTSTDYVLREHIREIIQTTLSKEFKAPVIYLKAGNPRVRILHKVISLQMLKNVSDQIT